jgi:hypothetical protein
VLNRWIGLRCLGAVVVALVLACVGVVAVGAEDVGSDAPSSGKYVADIGFRPDVNGFSFENYGRAETNLTGDDLRRLFGDGVCSSTTGGKCTLTPVAKTWMAEINKGMSGGHCMGMAELSLLMYLGKVKASDFGVQKAAELKLPGNARLQREIAYWWSTQATIPAALSQARELTPNEVLDKLVESFKAGPGAPETYALGIYRRTPPLSGHAILPYAVEDRGNGVYWVMVYDNNWPGAARHIEVNRTANTWRYFASTNPSEKGTLYEGDARTGSLILLPTSPRMVQQSCPFCDDDGTAVGQQYDEVWLDGDGHLLLTDSQGRRFGYTGGGFVQEIPGISYSIDMGAAPSWLDDGDPTYFVPVGMPLTITVDGTGLTQAVDDDVIVTGRGYVLSVRGIHLDPGQKDKLVMSPGPNGGTVSYTSADDESPDIVIDHDAKDADYSFVVRGVTLKGGGTINASLDKTQGQFKIAVSGSKGPGTYAVEMHRTIGDDEQVFSHDGVGLNPGDTAYLNFGRWNANGDTIQLAIDRGSKGSATETVDLTDDGDGADEDDD